LLRTRFLEDQLDRADAGSWQIADGGDTGSSLALGYALRGAFSPNPLLSDLARRSRQKSRSQQKPGGDHGFMVAATTQTSQSTDVHLQVDLAEPS